MFAKNVDQNTLQALYSRMTPEQLIKIRDSLYQNLQCVEDLLAAAFPVPEVTGND